MAQMIPVRIFSSSPSEGEQLVFQQLQSDASTSDWLVLHSLDLPEHLRQVQGEIDFVVIIPGKGILCLEVKGCRKLRRQQGLWYYGTDTQPDPRGPFKQASEGMHSLRRRLVNRYPEFSKIVFWSAVVFPFIDFPDNSEEWHRWQVIDRASLEKHPVTVLAEKVLNQARLHLASKDNARWFNPSSREPTSQQCQRIAALLRPDFEVYTPPETLAEQRTQEVKRFTEEQFSALDAMEQNDRVIFQGPAGTGKTFLALEAVRRKRRPSSRVLLLCYNRLLGKWLKSQIPSGSSLVVARTLHAHMLSVAGIPVPKNAGPGFWEAELPQLAVDRLIDGQGDQVYDEMIIDEAQDILRRYYLDFLDLSVDGGLSSGRWLFFGDFEKQAIYGGDSTSLEQIIRSRLGHATRYSLRINCRNTPRIAELARLLGGLEPAYLRVLRPDDGLEPELLYFSNMDHQSILLEQAIRSLRSEGYVGSEIVVLSTKNDGTCAAAQLVQRGESQLLPYRGKWQRSSVRYTSIHAFKGLESPAVIVTDIESMDSETMTVLFYIAVTRALHRLVILISETARSQLASVLLGKSN